MKNFDDFFNSSNMKNVLNKAKTISKEECRSIYKYFEEYSPKVLLEFGTQFGCSTRFFYDMSRYLGIKTEIHSWDIVDRVKCINKNDFTFHLDNITNNEEEVFDKYNPDLLFLDAHPYVLTKNLMSISLERKINFMTHDVSLGLYESLKERSNNFKEKNTYGAWELYIIEEMFGKSVLESDLYEDDKIIIEFIRDRFGLSIIYNK